MSGIEPEDWDGQIRSHDELAEEHDVRISRQDAAAEYEKAKANADKQIEQLQSELAMLQDAVCGTCGRALAPDGDCYGCETDRLQGELDTLRGWKEGALQNIEPLRAELTALKAENTRLLGRATTAEINLGREKIAYDELVEMVQGITQCGFNNQWCMDKLKTFIGSQFIRNYHPCEDCSCPVRKGDKTCEWCEAEQKGTA